MDFPLIETLRAYAAEPVVVIVKRHGDQHWVALVVLARNSDQSIRQMEGSVSQPIGPLARRPGHDFVVGIHDPFQRGDIRRVRWRCHLLGMDREREER
jgi:hypothetical protein